MTEYRKLKINREMPTFIVEFWNVDKEKIRDRGHDVSTRGLSKKWRGYYFEGIIEHVQTGDKKMFHKLSQFHAFIERYRMTR